MIEGAGRQESAILRVGPGHLPHWSFVTPQVRYVLVLLAHDLKDLNCLVRGARSKLASVVVKLCIVHGIYVP